MEAKLTKDNNEKMIKLNRALKQETRKYED